MTRRPPAPRHTGVFRAARGLPRAVRGAASAVSVVWIAGALMLGGLAVDVAYALLQRARLQHAADAAALAAALSLDDPDRAVDLARALLARNLPVDDAGEVPGAVDLALGRLDDAGAFQAFDPDRDPHETPDAVRVALARGPGADPVPAFLLRIVGHDAWNVSVAAVATRRESGAEPGCSALALSTADLDVNGGARIGAGVCLHGETGARIGGGALLDPAMTVSAADAGRIRFGGGIRGAAPAEVSRARSLPARVLPTLEDRLEALRARLSGRDAAGPEDLPAFLLAPDGTARVIESADDPLHLNPRNLVRNAVYIAPGEVRVEGNTDLDGVAILAGGDVILGGGAPRPIRALLFARDELRLGGGIRWGDAAPDCAATAFSAYLLAGRRLQLAGGARLNGVLVAAPTLHLGGGNRLGGAFRVEAANDVAFGGGDRFEACPAPVADALGFALGGPAAPAARLAR